MQNTDIYQHRRHNKNLLMVHLIFVTKYRKDLFFGEFRNDIKQYMYETCVKYHWYIKRMETDKDHIHILLQYNPTDSITNIVSCLKQHSTYKAMETLLELFKPEILERENLMVRWLLCSFDWTSISRNY